MASREVVMPVLPRITVSDAENFWVSGGMATERPRPREWDAIKAPAAKRDERWRKSRRSMETSGGGLRKAYTCWDAGRAEFVSENCLQNAIGYLVAGYSSSSNSPICMVRY